MTSAAPFQWSVFTTDIDGTPGSGKSGSRPVLVVSRESANEVLPVVTVLPLATRRANRRVRVFDFSRGHIPERDSSMAGPGPGRQEASVRTVGH